MILVRDATAPDPRVLWGEIHGTYRAELEWLEAALIARIQGATISPVALHLIQAGGKRIRPLLAWLSGAALGAPTHAVHPAALAAELSHAATLLHDDVLDDAAERRGVAAARILHGNRMSILGGDLLLSRALDVVTRTRCEAIIFSFSRSLEHMIDGEVLQQQHGFRTDVPESVYRRIVTLKTGALFAWTASAAAWLSGADQATADAFEEFGRQTGIAFQILDDYLDWTGEASIIGKAVRADLKEGKPSLAVIYGCEMNPAIAEWLEAHLKIDAPAPDDQAIASLATRLQECGALDRVQRTLNDEVVRGLSLLTTLPMAKRCEPLTQFAYLLQSRNR